MKYSITLFEQLKRSSTKSEASSSRVSTMGLKNLPQQLRALDLARIKALVSPFSDKAVNLLRVVNEDITKRVSAVRARTSNPSSGSAAGPQKDASSGVVKPPST